MRCRIADYPTRFYVSSRTEEGVEYLVSLNEHLIGVHDGVRIFNGHCGVKGAPETMCRDFRFRCQKALKQPGIVCRCAHIRFALENCASFMVDELDRRDPNTHENNQS